MSHWTRFWRRVEFTMALQRGGETRRCVKLQIISNAAAVNKDFIFFEMEKLIELVRNYPCLYDMGDKSYKDIVLKADIWERIGGELNENGK